MGNRQIPYQLLHKAIAIFLMATLAWLTVSLPYVTKAQQGYQQLCKQVGDTQADDNPPSNTTEEKNESGVSLLSEYLHEMPVMEQHFIILTSYHKCHPSDLYLAYHPRLVVPPPEV